MKGFSFKYAPVMVFQLILMVLYFVFVRYGGDKDYDIRGFEDTHVMIFVGFGFLMTFLKKYCYSALGYNWLLAAVAIQWALLCQSFFGMTDNTIYITKKSLLEADVMSATVLITFGALLGVASASQLLFIAIIEVVAASVNIWIVTELCHAADVGGSMAIHAFGAYFGLGVSLGLKIMKTAPASEEPKTDLNGSSYISDVTAMIGSLFLWIYWPSFNSALTQSNEEYQRAVVNTYLAIAAATVTSFFMSASVNHAKGKLDMVHIQNSTLAGGVAVGSVANMYIGAGGAIAIGIAAGIISVLGYKYLTPALAKIGILDTCGVNNLHGMPGVLSGLLSILFAGLVTTSEYGKDLNGIFSEMKADGTGRSAQDQALYQFIALAVTLAISTVSGLLTGLLVRLPVFESLKENEKYSDEPYWELP